MSGLANCSLLLGLFNLTGATCWLWINVGTAMCNLLQSYEETPLVNDLSLTSHNKSTLGNYNLLFLWKKFHPFNAVCSILNCSLWKPLTLPMVNLVGGGGGIWPFGFVNIFQKHMAPLRQTNLVFKCSKQTFSFPTP